MNSTDFARDATGAEKRHTIAAALRAATRWRLLAVLLGPPCEGLAAELAELGNSLDEPTRSLARKVASIAARNDNLFTLYHRLLGAASVRAPTESSYDDSTALNKGPLLADLAGFYKAFAFDPNAEWPEPKDHVAVEASFLSFLCFKLAQAMHAGADEAAEVTRNALLAFWKEHLGRFLPLVLRDLREACAGAPYYEHAVELAWELLKPPVPL